MVIAWVVMRASLLALACSVDLHALFLCVAVELELSWLRLGSDKDVMVNSFKAHIIKIKAIYIWCMIGWAWFVASTVRNFISSYQFSCQESSDLFVMGNDGVTSRVSFQLYPFGVSNLYSRGLACLWFLGSSLDIFYLILILKFSMFFIINQITFFLII